MSRLREPEIPIWIWSSPRTCTPESIARFSWALFEAWLGAGAPADERWAFIQLAWLGDDDIAYRLAKLMESGRASERPSARSSGSRCSPR